MAAPSFAGVKSADPLSEAKEAIHFTASDTNHAIQDMSQDPDPKDVPSEAEAAKKLGESASDSEQTVPSWEDGTDLKNLLESPGFIKDSGTVLAAKLFSNHPGKEPLQKIQGSKVHWKGILKNSYMYLSDFYFRSGSGSKAFFEIAQVESGPFGTKCPCFAVVSFPKECSEYLQKNIGRIFEFAGTIVKVKTFSREIYLQDGAFILCRDGDTSFISEIEVPDKENR